MPSFLRDLLPAAAAVVAASGCWRLVPVGFDSLSSNLTALCRALLRFAAAARDARPSAARNGS